MDATSPRIEFQIYHRPGLQHAVPDYVSRLDSGEPAETTYDDLPDASLFHMNTIPDDNADEWIMEMTQFLPSTCPWMRANA